MSLTIAHANVRSLPGNFVDASLELKKHSRGIVCFTETWLDSSYSQMSLQVDGFHPAFRHDRVGKRGGGVAVYVSAALVVKRLNDMELPESVFLEIVLSKSRRLLLVACYRPPINVKADIESYFSRLQSAVTSTLSQRSYHSTFIIGDLYAKHSDWLAGSATNEAGVSLQAMCCCLGLEQLVGQATRFGKDGLPGSLLDLVLTDRPELVRDVSVLPPVGTSDHCLVAVTLLSKWQKAAKKIYSMRRQYNRADWDGLNENLVAIDWESELGDLANVDDAVSRFTGIYTDHIKQSVPRKMSFVKPSSKPWFTPHLYRLRRIRDRLFRRFCSSSKNPTAVSAKAYKTVRNYYVAELRRAERSYYQSLAQKLSAREFGRNSRQWWKTARTVCGLNGTSSIPALDSGTGFATDSRLSF